MMVSGGPQTWATVKEEPLPANCVSSQNRTTKPDIQL